MIPPTSIRIMGINWTIDTTDIIGDDPTDASQINQGKSVMTITDDVLPPRRNWHLFWCILASLQAELLPPDLRHRAGGFDTMHQAIWTALRDNWEVVSGWFGLDGNPPAVADGTTLRINGMTYTLTRPVRIQGQGLGYFGICNTSKCAIEVRQGMSPGYTATTALHELIHASTHALCELWDDEAWVAPMSCGLAQVFFDNPVAMNDMFGERES